MLHELFKIYLFYYVCYKLELEFKTFITSIIESFLFVLIGESIFIVFLLFSEVSLYFDKLPLDFYFDNPS
jgi:hypothetical protein